MSNESNFLFQLLKEEIQSKFGKKIMYDSDCQALLKQIYTTTHCSLSVSTLKRIFGIVKSPSSPSKYTLDTLAQFLQFADWHDFINRFEKEKHPYAKQETWENLKERTNIITNTSLKSIKNKIGARFENFPIRKFALKRLEELLHSPKIATAFIAPNGYGKSTIGSQLTEEFFIGNDAKYPDDIVCLIDGSIFYNLVTLNQRINRLYNLIEFDPQKSFSAVFRENPELIKGRFVLIIDGIDDIYPDNEKIDHFIGNLINMISFYENIGWFKLLITCSPSKWRMFLYRMQSNPIFKSFWFDVLFQGRDQEFINVPLLKIKEIKAILETNHFDQTLDELCFNYPDILDLISNPYELHLFMSAYKRNGQIRDIDLLDQYINNTVLSSPYSTEKFSIVKSFFTLGEYGKKSAEIRKEELKLSSLTTIAYDELIQKGILYEYTIHDSYLSLNTYVRFTHNLLYAYYLVNILIKEKGLDIEFLKSIIADYSSKPHLQCNILKYTIKILFKEEQIELLKNIFSIIEKDKLPGNTPPFNTPCCVLTNVISTELRKNKKMRETLIPYYAQSEVGHVLYFEKFFDIDGLLLHSANDLDFYLQYNHSNEAKLYFYYLKFIQHFLFEDTEQCKREYGNILTLEFPAGNDSLNSAYYFVPQIMYQSVYENKLGKNILKQIYCLSEKLMKNGIQTRTESPHFEFAIIFALNYGRKNAEIIELSHYIFENYDLTDLKLSCFYQFFLLVYAKALLNKGETEKAFEFYDQVNLKKVNVPDQMKYYFRIRVLLIMSEFLIKMGKSKKAKRKLEKIKTLSQMLNSSYFYECAKEIEQKIPS